MPKITQEELMRRMKFEERFGERPSLAVVRGGKQSIKRQYLIDGYDRALEDFVDYTDYSFLQERELKRLQESTGASVIGWESKNGIKYFSIIGGDIDPAYRFKQSLFSSGYGDPVSIVWVSLLEKGNVLDLPDNVPGSTDAWDNIGAAIRAKNEENKREKLESNG